MPNKRPEVQRLQEIEDPVERIAAADAAMDDARVLLSDLAAVRGRAIYKVFAEHGGGKAAKLLGMSRTALYRAIKDHTPSTKHQLRDAEKLLRQTAIELEEMQAALEERQRLVEEEMAAASVEVEGADVEGR